MDHPALNYRELPLRYIRDPRLGHRLGRNFPNGQHIDETWGYRWLGTNGNGFYAHDTDIAWGPPIGDTFRIILLGGSAAMGLGASRRGSTIGACLEENLRRTSGARVEVLNCAVGDYTTSQSLLYFFTELVEFQPNAVISLDGFNDFSHSTWGTKYSNARWLPNTTRSFDDGLEAILTWDGSLTDDIIAELKLRRSPRAIRAEIRRRVRRGQHATIARASHGFVWDDPQAWSTKLSAIDWYLRNLASMAYYCRGVGIPYLHVIQPALLWPSPKALGPAENELLAKFNERMPRLAQLCESYYACLAPRYSEFVKNLGGGGPTATAHLAMVDGTSWLQDRKQETYFDPVHYNDCGQSAVAEHIANEIRASKWLE